jgi:hypothetical protein
VLVGGGLLGVVSLLLIAYCVLDVATTRGTDVRGLPKPLWFVVLLVPLFGALFWFLFGRPRGGASRVQVLPDPAAPARAPDDDEAFLRELRRRAEEQRRKAERERRDEDDRPA